jgi:hypothetical protein
MNYSSNSTVEALLVSAYKIFPRILPASTQSTLQGWWLKYLQYGFGGPDKSEKIALLNIKMFRSRYKGKYPYISSR